MVIHHIDRERDAGLVGGHGDGRRHGDERIVAVQQERHRHRRGEAGGQGSLGGRIYRILGDQGIPETQVEGRQIVVHDDQVAGLADVSGRGGGNGRGGIGDRLRIDNGLGAEANAGRAGGNDDAGGQDQPRRVAQQLHGERRVGGRVPGDGAGNRRERAFTDGSHAGRDGEGRHIVVRDCQ